VLTPARASDLSEIKETQKQILQRLDEQDKVLKDIQTKLQQMPATAVARPQVDPNKIYQIALGNSAIRGPKAAPVTIVEFSDFQCPFCAQSTGLVDEVLAAYPTNVRFVYKQFPLEQIHPNAMNAAKASIAARNQGKFWEMHDELFKISKNLTMDEIRKKAELLGLDMKKFDADFASPETEKIVRDDLELGRTVDVQGTPTFFINGKRVLGTNRSLEGMKSMVDDALKQPKG
jgi:protein-disulfide isomerase